MLLNMKKRVNGLKVGIFTFPNSISYGATLQMYALYHTVSKLGHVPEIINYHNAYMKAERHMMAGHASWKDKARKMARGLLHHRLYSAFRRFEKRNLLCYPEKPFADAGKLPEIGKRYGAVICGSDQVWNPDITDTDLSFFLNFCGEGTRRISYAPSFGIDTFSPEFCEAIQDELAQFYALSVRETPGQALVQSLLGKEVPIVADPTLLMDAAEWEKMERKHPAACGDYILYYTVRRSTSLMRRCQELAEKTGMKIVVVGGNPLKKLKQRDQGIEYAVDISPEEWLYLLHHARYVVTNSFHGTAFSINFRKDFYVEFSSLTNSRLTYIVKTLGLTSQVVGKEAISGAAADYTVADKVLPAMRNASLDYLTEALK